MYPRGFGDEEEEVAVPAAAAAAAASPMEGVEELDEMAEMYAENPEHYRFLLYANLDDEENLDVIVVDDDAGDQDNGQEEKENNDDDDWEMENPVRFDMGLGFHIGDNDSGIEEPNPLRLLYDSDSFSSDADEDDDLQDVEDDGIH